MAYRVFSSVYCASIALLVAAMLFIVPASLPLKPYAIVVSPSPSAGWFSSPLAQPDQNPRSLFVPHHGGTLSVAWNDRLLKPDPVGDVGQVNRYQSATIVDLPQTAPAAGAKAPILKLHLEMDQNEAGVGPVYVGPTADIRTAFAAQTRFIALVQTLMPSAVGFALIASLFLIFFSSTPLRYFYFLLCLLFNVFLEFEPRVRLFGISLHPYISYVGTLYLFILFQTGSHWWNGSKRERRIAVGLVIGIFLVLIGLDSWFGLDAPQTDVPRILAFAIPAILIVITSVVRAIGAVRNSRALGQAAIAFATLVYSAFLLNLIRLYLPASTDFLFSIHFLTKAMGGLAIVGLAGSALAYELGAYRTARHQVASMTAISAGHHLALDEQGRALKLEIERRAILEERQRFTRDMHDGIGGQLLSMLIKSRSGALDPEALEKDLSHSINDLRLITASLDASDGSLHDALKGFAVRVEDQVRAAGMALDWQEAAKVGAIVFPPRATLDVLRIMQEAVTNAIRHSGAASLSLDIGLGAGLTVRICDDGAGLPVNWEARLGAGIRNMRDRAERLGGTIEFGTAAARRGTCVTLQVPVPRTSGQ